jgi:hemolysin activation/secretion protein
MPRGALERAYLAVIQVGQNGKQTANWRLLFTPCSSILWLVAMVHMRVHVLAAICCALAATGMSCRALAQVPLPSPADPGRIDERVSPQRPPERKPELPEMRVPQPRESPEGLRAVRLTLRELRIEGATAIPVERLQAHVSRYVGREITGANIFALAHQLTALYRAEGYILSQVIVPPQSFSDGRLALRVVEGYIANVRVEGDPRLAAQLAELGERIKASRPLRASVLERYLLIANDLAGVHLRSVLSPSQTPGAADLTLIASVRRIEGFVSLDNYGSKYLGPGQLSVGLAANHLLGTGDQLRFLGVGAGSHELRYGQLAYSRVVNAEGLRLGASASRARTRPGDALEPFDVRGRADTFTLSAGYPLWRSANGSLLGRALFDHRNIDTDILGSRVIEDHIRALRLGVSWLALDRLDGHNTLDLELSQGLDGTKPDDPLKSRAGADGRFHKLVFDYERFQPLGSRYGLTLGAGGQWTRKPLLSSEQYALGGRRFGRAYEPAELVGERALAFRAEPAYLGLFGSDWLKSYQLYGFYDGGKVWSDNTASSSLASAGFGSRAAFGRYVNATLEAAWPLTRPVASYQASGHGNNVRILGSMVVRF